MRMMILALLLLALLVAGCGQAEPSNGGNGDGSAPAAVATNAPDATPDQAAPTAAPTVAAGDGYPAPPAAEAAADSGYPGPPTPEGLLAEPPNPERDLPQPAADLGALGGVLVREVSDAGFLPVMPQALFLGEVLSDSQGREALIARRDDSPQAQLFPTGIFIFNEVPPGTYGLVIDVGFAQFPLTDSEGGQLLVVVEPGQAQDLGQLMVRIPGQ